MNKKQTKIALIMTILLSLISILRGNYNLIYIGYDLDDFLEPESLLFLFAIPIILIGTFLLVWAKDKKPE